jgi:sulfatase maturation enzyme AslB (radical SAM superfamily)
MHTMRTSQHKVLDRALRVFFLDALRVALRNPRQAYFFLRTVLWQRKASRIRRARETENLRVPPIIILSVTNRCNLTCEGCYARILHPEAEEELDQDRLRSIVGEAKDLGVSFFVLAGGEPFLRHFGTDPLSA